MLGNSRLIFIACLFGGLFYFLTYILESDNFYKLDNYDCLMGFKTRFKKLETTVSESETYPEDDFTSAILYLKDDRYVNFELPKAVEIKQGDRILFHDCKIEKGNQCWYINNKGYSLLEIFSRGEKSSYFKLKGSEAYCLERLAAKRFAAEKN